MSAFVPFERKVSPTEQVYCVLNDSYGPLNIQFVFNYSGNIDPNDFSKAVSEASAACPGMLLVKEGHFWKPSHKSIPIRYVDSLLVDGSKFSDAVFKQKFNPALGNAEIHVCKKPSVIIVRVFHGIADARGVLIWVDAIFDALNNSTIKKAESTITDVEFIKQHQSGKHPLNLKFDQHTARPFNQINYRIPYWKQRTIKGQYSNVTTRLVEFLATYFNQPVNRFMIPVDLRRHNSTLNTTANLSMPIFLEVEPGEAHQTIFAKFIFALKQKKELNSKYRGNFLSRISPRFVYKIILNQLIRSNKKQVAIAAISHLGRFDLNKWSTPNFSVTDFNSLPSQQTFTPVFFHICEMNNEVNLVLGSYPAFISHKDADHLLEEIEAFFKQETT